ncbi:MAG: amidohydrolase [Anaerolineaceae bacterium]|nr:amidohydrolase [Anaerolineaceae bacterium]
MKASTPDLVLLNGRIHTLASRGPLASALVVQAGRIVYVGDDEGAREWLPAVSPEAALDLKTACVIPGLTDAHMHFEWYSLGLQRLNAELNSLERVLEKVADRAASQPPGSWITGYGWNHNAWGGDLPSRADLDRVAPEHPVALQAKSGHAYWVNTRALELAGVNAATHDPAGGRILRGEGGKPNGVLLEDAQLLVEQVIPVPSLAERIEAYRVGIRTAHQFGLTGVHDMDGPRSFQVWQAMHAAGQMDLRVTKSIPVDLVGEAIRLGLRSGFGDDWLRIGAVKIFADGALGSQTAWMLEPYAGDPHNSGISTLPCESIREAVMQANANGLATAIHAIGDRAVREVLDVYEEVSQKLANPGLRNRIEHLQLIHPADAGRLAALNVIASMQPVHATSDMEIAERYWGKRCSGAYAWKTQLDQGAVLALGSDSPVESLDPRLGLHAAITRRRADGSPGPQGWYAEQRLTVKAAVRGFTWGPAYATGMETQLGSLERGKLADLTILDRDIFAISPMEMLETRVVGTVVGGKLVYTAL